ncbi:hypothetical protein EXIGLDRAFT_729899 [Exidia glandulosa HHB12029]|uniref:Uncharacterized protein n=1 Tax=Exidia glandulosa HHB12029 TaxID=1314781 RepID=A0A165CEJ0_EXIGL|nr:hypothetical protein EXIGLDRAFT_729899 [Exidia glandulosa HHB12029]
MHVLLNERVKGVRLPGVRGGSRNSPRPVLVEHPALNGDGLSGDSAHALLCAGGLDRNLGLYTVLVAGYHGAAMNVIVPLALRRNSFTAAKSVASGDTAV